MRDFYDTALRLQPLGLAYLKASLVKRVEGAEAEVWDRRGNHGRRTVKPPPELSHLTPFYTLRDQSPFSTFGAFYHFGSSFEETALAVERAKPDIVGISSLFSAYHQEAVALAKEIRRRSNALLVAGGPHATAAPETLLKDGAFDFVIAGEGERPLVLFAKALQAGSSPSNTVPNLCWLEGGKLQRSEREPNYHLSELSPPDFSDFPTDAYRLGRLPLSTIITSRGCPNRCSFCSVENVFGPAFRQRPVPDVLSEVENRYGEGYRAFDFEDDNLALDRKWFLELLNALSGRFGERGVAFQAMNGISFQSLDREVLEAMRRAGFIHLNLSLVSADDQLCRTLGRPSSVEKFKQVAEEAGRLGFSTVAYQILGLEGEPLASQLETMKTLARLPLIIGVSPFYRVPGLKNLGNEPDREGMVRARLTALGTGENEGGRKAVYTLFVTARIVNFLKSYEGKETATLDEALSALGRRGKREGLGEEILRKLLAEKVLCAATEGGLKSNPNFDAALFFRLWRSLGHIRARSGALISL